MDDIFDRKPFSINDLACDEKGNPVKNNMDIWLEDMKAEYKEMQRRLEGLKALWGNGFWRQDEAYDSVIQFKEWTANEMMKLLGFPIIDDQTSSQSRQSTKETKP